MHMRGSGRRKRTPWSFKPEQYPAPHLSLETHDMNGRAVKKAQIPASKEPIGLLRHDGKRPDGATLVSWTRQRPLAWDVTVPDTFAASHIQFISSSSCAAADEAAVNKTAKYVEYVELRSTHHFVTIAVQTSGA